jgi:hypothetical protein
MAYDKPKFDRQVVVKAVETHYFKVELIMDRYGRYVVSYRKGDVDQQSEWITDYATASYIFDLKLQELEGH